MGQTEMGGATAFSLPISDVHRHGFHRRELFQNVFLRHDPYRLNNKRRNAAGQKWRPRLLRNVSVLSLLGRPASRSVERQSVVEEKQNKSARSV